MPLDRSGKGTNRLRPLFTITPERTIIWLIDKSTAIIYSPSIFTRGLGIMGVLCPDSQLSLETSFYDAKDVFGPF